MISTHYTYMEFDTIPIYLVDKKRNRDTRFWYEKTAVHTWDLIIYRYNQKNKSIYQVYDFDILCNTRKYVEAFVLNQPQAIIKVLALFGQSISWLTGASTINWRITRARALADSVSNDHTVVRINQHTEMQQHTAVSPLPSRNAYPYCNTACFLGVPEVKNYWRID